MLHFPNPDPDMLKGIWMKKSIQNERVQSNSAPYFFFKQLNIPFSIAVVGEEKRDTFSRTELQPKSPH